MFREQLILKALAALSEIADECGKQPARKTLSLRFLLAYTYVASGSDPGKKWIWTDFWKHATSPRAEVEHQQMLDDYVRGTGARSALNGICREVGYPPDMQFLEMLASLRSKGRRPESEGLPAPANDGPADDHAA